MKKISCYLVAILLFSGGPGIAQRNDAIVEGIVKEATENSQLEKLAHELLDVIGPRLVGSPQMQQANDWAVAKYKTWNISAKNEKWGEWRGWERGASHIDMVAPRVKSLEGMQLAWSPGTAGKTVLFVKKHALPFRVCSRIMASLRRVIMPLRTGF